VPAPINATATAGPRTLIISILPRHDSSEGSYFDRLRRASTLTAPIRRLSNSSPAPQRFGPGPRPTPVRKKPRFPGQGTGATHRASKGGCVGWARHRPAGGMMPANAIWVRRPADQSPPGHWRSRLRDVTARPRFRRHGRTRARCR
jgi:hypothetical protein